LDSKNAQIFKTSIFSDGKVNLVGTFGDKNGNLEVSLENVKEKKSE